MGAMVFMESTQRNKKVVGGGALARFDMDDINGGDVTEDETAEHIVVASPYVVSVGRDKGVWTGEGTLEPGFQTVLEDQKF
jgi:hypothetical protein